MPKYTSKYIQAHVAAFDKNTDDYKYLLLKRAQNVHPYPSIWQVITGCLDSGETAYRAAMREFSEETGLTPLKTWVIPYVTTFFDAYQDEINASPVFGILVDKKEKVILSGEHEKYIWADYEKCIQKLILPTHREGTKIFRDAILKSKDNTHFACDSEKL